MECKLEQGDLQMLGVLLLINTLTENIANAL